MAAIGDRTFEVTEAYAALQGLLDTYGPVELREARERALARFQQEGIPTHRDEEWKYTNLRRLREEEFSPAYGATLTRQDLAETLAGKIGGVCFTFVNGQFAPELSDLASLPEGVFLGTLQQAWEEAPNVISRLGSVATLEGRLGSTNDTRFVSLNHAHLSEGVVLSVGKGIALEPVIHIRWINHADHAAIQTHPRVFVELGENAQAKLVESYVGTTGTSFTNAVTEVIVGKSANLEHVRVQDETLTSLHVANLFVHQESISVYTSTNAAFGGEVGRVDLNVFLNGEHTETWLNGAYVGRGSQTLDNHTRIDHAFPNCNSFEVYKGILDDQSNGVFNGKIFVYEDAQKTDAKQTNQAILLSGEASIDTKPQLEIFADDVKCTHGATVGQLREDAMFYLRARGIPYSEARSLLVYAFAAEVFEKITIDEARESIEARLFEKLS